MEIQAQPDYLIFAQDSKTGELLDFPNISRGWGLTIEQTQGKPPLEWMNGAFNRVDKNILYLLQQGVPEWNNAVLYPIGAVIKYKNIIYVAMVQNNNAIPSTNTTKWSKLIDDASLTKKGIVQLSSATDSDSEVLASTPKAVKMAMDKANSAATAASNAQTAANTANTNANGRVPSTRKVNNKALSADITLVASDVSALALTGGTVSGATNFTSTLKQAGNDVVTQSGFISLLAGSGYQKLPSGLIIQWGTYTTSRKLGNYTITFPVTFPSACLSVTYTKCNTDNAATTGGDDNTCIGNRTKSSFQLRGDGNDYVSWIAIGY